MFNRKERLSESFYLHEWCEEERRAEAYMHGKRPTKEVCIHEKRPTKEVYEHEKRPTE